MRISFCITCMNRLFHLNRTIIDNLNLINEFNKTHEDKFNISLCNYDSKDDLDEFVQTNLQLYLHNNTLTYFRIYNKKFFNRSHAKNIAHKYANGDVVINLDCDNILRYDVLLFIYDTFNELTNNYTINDVYIWDNLYMGFLGMSKKNFVLLGGYNEKILTYGYEDIELRKRIEKHIGCKDKLLPEQFNYDETCVIHHDDDIRAINDDAGAYNYDKNISENNNIQIMEYYIMNNIKNPNEYNNIVFGEI